MRLIDVDKVKEELKVNGLGYQYYILGNAPIVEAIPVEWIRKQIENPPYSHSWELGERWKGEYDTCLMVLLEDWGKENEK